MSEKKYDDPERTLVTLDQLSQTIEVMTSVVNRLRRHLSEQIKAQPEVQEPEKIASPQSKPINSTVEAISGPKLKGEANLSPEPQQTLADSARRESIIVEISQQEAGPVRKATKILH